MKDRFPTPEEVWSNDGVDPEYKNMTVNLPAMKDQEVFQLCQEVFSITEWDCPNTHRWAKESPDSEVKLTSRNLRAWTYWPLYTSDYLLSKLPPTIVARGEGFCTATRIATTAKQLIGTEADTPLKALLKLAIALHNAGVKL